MRPERIVKAKKAAQEFLKRVETMTEAEDVTDPVGGPSEWQQSPRHRGDVRRQSMELTRALADMRKP